MTTACCSDFSARPPHPPVLTRRHFVAVSVPCALALACSVPSRGHADVGPAPDEAHGGDAQATGEAAGTVTLGGVAFSVPADWVVEQSSRTDVHITWTVVGADGSFAGHATLDCGDRTELYGGLAFDELADALAAAYVPPAMEGVVWDPERRDVANTMCAARYQLAAYRDTGLAVGAVYVGAPPVNHFFTLSVLVDADADAADAALSTAEQMWDTAAWQGAWAGDLARSKAEMLADTQERYAAEPWYNPYWTVSDFTCTLNTAAPETPYLDQMRTQFATPEGIAAWESEIEQISLYPSYPAAQGYDLWCMRRTDSSGDAYLRSTVEVEGIGIADVAYYEGYSSTWYIASTGQAVSLDIDYAWRPFGDLAANPWTPYFFG